MTKSYLGETKIVDIDGEKITLKSFTYAVQKQVAELAKLGKDIESVDLFLEATIKEWTLTDAEGNMLPITRDVLDGLSGAFVSQIMKEATSFNNITPEQVKN